MNLFIRFCLKFINAALLIAVTFFPFANNTALATSQPYDTYHYSLLYFYGRTVSAPLARILYGNFRTWPENVQSAELAYTLNEENTFRQLFKPLVGVVQVAGNTAVRYGRNEHTIYEVEPYLIFRWTHFPWDEYVNTSLALGEGVSYVTAVPAIEKKDNDNTKRFLNYLMLEVTVAPPQYPHWQLVARIHHRSGAYGLYHAGNSGSNTIGLGLRYFF